MQFSSLTTVAHVWLITTPQITQLNMSETKIIIKIDNWFHGCGTIRFLYSVSFKLWKLMKVTKSLCHKAAKKITHRSSNSPGWLTNKVKRRHKARKVAYKLNNMSAGNCQYCFVCTEYKRIVPRRPFWCRICKKNNILQEIQFKNDLQDMHLKNT